MEQQGYVASHQLECPISPVIQASKNAGGTIVARITRTSIKWFYFTESPRVTPSALATIAGNAINTCCIMETRKCITFINVLLTQHTCKQPQTFLCSTHSMRCVVMMIMLSIWTLYPMHVFANGIENQNKMLQIQKRISFVLHNNLDYWESLLCLLGQVQKLNSRKN